MAYAGMALFSHNLSRERASRVADIVSSEPLRALSESDVYWDKIASIEPDGVEEVFDLTVPGPHNFVANEIIAHNSIEQDADVVAFIHREDHYTTQEEWERKFPTEQYPQNIAGDHGGEASQRSCRDGTAVLPKRQSTIRDA